MNNNKKDSKLTQGTNLKISGDKTTTKNENSVPSVQTQNHNNSIKENIKICKTLLKNKIITIQEFEEFKSRIYSQANQNNNFLSFENKKSFDSNNKNSSLNDSDVILEVINLTKHYAKRPAPAIENLNFKLRKNQFHVFIGANGAGKTTTIKALVGAYAKWDGQILINGKPNTKTISKVSIGYIPEKSLFPKSMNTKQYLISMAMVSGISKKEAIEFANKTLENLNLQSLANKNPLTFSSGQQKKILLAQALVHNPDILIMDEPTANLDPLARNEFYAITKQLQDQGKTIFVSSHILAEVGKYANYVTILDGGQIVYSGELNPKDDLEELYFRYVKKGSVDTGLKE